MFTFFQQRANNNLWIAARFNTYEPTVIFEISFSFSPKFRLKRVTDGLSATSLSREVDALQVRKLRRTSHGCLRTRRIHNIRHGISNDLPIFGVNLDVCLAGNS